MRNLLELYDMKTSTLANPAKWFKELFADSSVAGVNVTRERALKHTAVFSCIRVLAETIGCLPIHLYSKEIKNKRVYTYKEYNHPINKVLKKPNKNMTRTVFLENMILHLNLKGEHISQVIRNRKGEIIELVPLKTENLEVYLKEGSSEVFYMYNHEKLGRVYLKRSDVLRVIGLSLDGYFGISPIEYNKSSIGLSMATEKFGINFFEKGANASGIFKKAGVLSDEAYERLRNDLKSKYAGLTNSGKPMLLEDGLEFEKLSINNNDSQFLETRKYQRSEIAGMFRVPSHMINDLEKATFSNIEHLSMDFARYSILPWVNRIEQAFNDILLDNSDKYEIKFNLNGILRADTKTRYEAYGKAIRDGWMSRNEARVLEDMNYADGLDEFLYPLNMTKEGQNGQTGTK